jgi:hypothetical protein
MTEASNGSVRLAPWGVVGVLAASLLVLSVQPAESAPALHVSAAEATNGQLAPSTVVLATGRPNRLVTTQLHIDGWTPGPTSFLVVIGRPGTTDDVGQGADQPPSAVLRQENQLLADTITRDSVMARFSPSAAGRYPVFLLLSGAEVFCDTAMPGIPLSVTQLGVIDVRD